MKKFKLILLSSFQIILYIGFSIAAINLDLHLNLFNWNPRLDLEAITYPLIVIVLCVLVWWVSPKLNKILIYVVNILQGLVVIIFAYFTFTDEVLGSGFLERDTYSPLWFKLTLIFFLILPVVISTFRLTNHSTGNFEKDAQNAG